MKKEQFREAALFASTPGINTFLLITLFFETLNCIRCSSVAPPRYGKKLRAYYLGKLDHKFFLSRLVITDL